MDYLRSGIMNYWVPVALYAIVLGLILYVQS